MSGGEDKVGSGVKDSLEEQSHENEIQQSVGKSKSSHTSGVAEEWKEAADLDEMLTGQ